MPSNRSVQHPRYLPAQLGLALPPGRGGYRKNAGRRPQSGGRAGVSHHGRDPITGREPIHVTLRCLEQNRNVAAGIEGGVVGGVTGGIVGGLDAAPPPPPPPPPPPAPVRVGGNIKPPTKTKDVRPVYPAIAQSARVQGVVIVEATIGPDGRVAEAKVLRSIPLLDAAALAVHSYPAQRHGRSRHHDGHGELHAAVDG